MFNEQKRHESHIDRMQDDVHRAKIAADKMRDEAVRLRSKIQDLRDERSNMKKQHESRVADDEAILQDRDSVIADLRSLLDRRNHELESLEQSVGTIQEERARIHLHSNEVTMSIVALRQELDEARAGATTARASEEAGRLQLARMMDEQLAQNQTNDASNKRC
jgi:predicted  nucleic acid-binding Zn-ribbon protein